MLWAMSWVAVKIQIWIALWVCVLVAIVPKRLALDIGLPQLVQILCVTPFEKTPNFYSSFRWPLSLRSHR